MCWSSWVLRETASPLISYCRTLTDTYLPLVKNEVVGRSHTNIEYTHSIKMTALDGELVKVVLQAQFAINTEEDLMDWVDRTELRFEILNCLGDP